VRLAALFPCPSDELLFGATVERQELITLGDEGWYAGVSGILATDLQNKDEKLI
jgi:hypothetical protein